MKIMPLTTNMTRRYLEGIGILLGMIFGAGVFALPYSVSKSGPWWGLLFFGTALFFILFLHLRFGEVAFKTPGLHRFTGYVRIWLGKKSEYLAMAVALFSYYGSLLVYGLLGGVFLANIFPFFNQFWWSIIFWLASSVFLLLTLEKIGVVNFLLTFPLLIFVLLLAWLAAPYFKTENILVGSNRFWFLPYGVFLFSLSGFAAIPETSDIFRGSSLKSLKTVIASSILLASLFYVIFALSVLGALGGATTADAISGLGAILGKSAIIVGSLIGFLAVFTSYLALGFDLREIFRYDCNFSYLKSWLLASFVPLALFFLGATNFLLAISVIGSIGAGFTGIFIVLMSRKLQAEKRKKGPAFILEIIVSLGLIAGIVYGIANIFWQ